MKVLLIGATGMVGRPILAELCARGHDVIVLARDPQSLGPDFPHVDLRAGDVFEARSVDAAAQDCEVMISSVALRDAAQAGRTPLQLSHVLADTARSLGLRWVSVGGAGSLKVSSGVDLVDTADFPAAARNESLGFRAALHWLRELEPGSLSWTVISPPIQIIPDAPRTGHYRTALDTLLRDAEGVSRISVADLAVAVVDEVENPRYPGRRFAVGD